MTESDNLSTPAAAVTPIRMACGFCRKRKLRCNREVPKCDSCLRFGYECEYGPPKEPPKRDQRPNGNPSHVKKFEDRLGRVESLLTQPTTNGKKRRTGESPDWDVLSPDASIIDIDQEQPFSKEAIQELEQLFFVFVHPSINIIHQPTYFRLISLEFESQPPIFLRHALCSLAACASKDYSHLKDSLYQSARRLLQEAEIKDQNFDKVTVVHAQTWIIIAVYELKECFMHRSLMSISRAVRLVQLMRLYRVDKRERLTDPSLDLIPSPEDWLQAEERRRLFWFVFLMDRYTGISMGWPTLIDRRDIRTLLPASDEAYENCTREPSVFLSEATNWDKHAYLSTSAAQIVGVDLSCTKIQDLIRLEISSDPEDWTGDTWAKYMKIESLLSGIFPVPQQFTIPPGKLNPGNVFLNMGQSSTIIMAHRIAKFQAQQSPLSIEMVLQGSRRCQDAAATIVRLMKMTSHWDIHMFHPCTAFCIYIAAVVYGKAWDSNPGDASSQEPLKFLLDCLHNFKKTTRLSFNLFQDIEQELPGMLGRLNGDPMALDLYHHFLNIEEDDFLEPRIMDHIHKGAPEPLPIPCSPVLIPEVTLTIPAPNLPFDAAAWTVEDPDIANVGKYL